MYRYKVYKYIYVCKYANKKFLVIIYVESTHIMTKTVLYFGIAGLFIH